MGTWGRRLAPTAGTSGSAAGTVDGGAVGGTVTVGAVVVGAVVVGAAVAATSAEGARIESPTPINMKTRRRPSIEGDIPHQLSRSCPDRVNCPF